MKAVFCKAYGTPDALKVVETSMPEPKENEMRIRNLASSITTADSFLRKGEPKFARLFLGWKKPKNSKFGTGFAGIVEKTGNQVKGFNVGDKVYGETALDFGANAEYLCIDPKKSIIRQLPDDLNFEEAAPVCDGHLTSYNFLMEIGKIKPGQHVLINGAAGALGVAAVQIAKAKGVKVSAVCSQKNGSFIRSLGADLIIDYHTYDFTQDANTYDVIFDTVGKSSLSRCKRALKENGVYLSPVLSFSLLLDMIKTSLFGNKKAVFQATGLRKQKELSHLLDQIEIMIENGQLTTIIDKIYSINRIAEAHEYIDSRHKRANIVMTFE